MLYPSSLVDEEKSLAFLFTAEDEGEEEAKPEEVGLVVAVVSAAKPEEV